MASKFRRGTIAYTQNGRRYTVEDVDDGVVYCLLPSGAETEFSEASLLTEAEWAARTDNKSGLVYGKLKQSRAYAISAPKLDRIAAEQVLMKIDRVKPGIVDFIAFTVATRILSESGEAPPAGLSIVKCRDIFEAAAPEVRATLAASILQTPPEAFVGAGKLGDNLMRAMLEKGMTGQEDAFEEFCDRPRL
jgi:hypothetical protein